MKRLFPLALLAFTRLAFADSSAAEKTAEAVVQRALVGPLAAKERDQSRFSRASLPPAERRVRILDERRDSKGDAFFTFAIDDRHGASSWRVAGVTGCVYAGRGDVFVKMGDRVRPAAILLGKNVKPAAEYLCQAAPGA